MAIRNMARQHREFQSRVDNAEKLLLYAHLAVSKHQALDASLAKAKSKSKHWEQETKAGGERIARMEKERNEANQEAKMACLAASAVGDTKAGAEEDLARVQEALAAVEEGRHKAEKGLTRVQEALATVEEGKRKVEVETARIEVK